MTFGEHPHTSLPKIKTNRANSALVKEEFNSDDVPTLERSLGSAVVETSHGPIEGIKLKTSRAGNTVTAYLGVPYARQEQMTHHLIHGVMEIASMTKKRKSVGNVSNVIKIWNICSQWLIRYLP